MELDKLLKQIADALHYPEQWVKEAYLNSKDKSIDDILLFCELKKEHHEKGQE